MPKKRKGPSFGNSDAKRKKAERAKLSEEERIELNASDAQRMSNSRANSTPEERAERSATEARRLSQSRANFTPEERAERSVTEMQRQKQSIERLRESLQNSEENRRETLNNAILKRIIKSKKSYLIARKGTNDGNKLHYIGEMNDICECMSKNFKAELPTDKKYKMCCQKGKVLLEPLTVYPAYFKMLLTEPDQDCKKFRENIRMYNNALGFASLGAKIELPPSNGPYCFRINGQIHHRTSSIHPKDQETPKYAQLYILDPSMANDYRMKNVCNRDCDDGIMAMLDSILREINPFAQAFKMLRDVEIEEEMKAKNEGRQMLDLCMNFVRDRNIDLRRYNAPSANCNEIAIVFHNKNGEPPFERDIQIYPKGQDFIKIKILSPNLDPMRYPILFPYGDPGWKMNMLHAILGKGRQDKVTLLEYYSSRISIRQNEFNPILMGGNLFQEYLCDAFCKIEGNNLAFIKHNQKTLRAELYSGLMDQVNMQAEKEGLKPGRLVILPSSFQGSPRAMQQHYQDAMAIVRVYGKPDLFITFTCNPNWKGIQENLEIGQNAHDRPDLISRVFHLKLKELLKDINEKHIFGIPKAMIHVIEFQKRGLPHAHILIILRDEDKIRNKEDIDAIVSAELPDPNTEKELFEIITKSMVHGPCGPLNPGSICMEKKGNQNKECKKGFPKPFCSETQENVNGYPIYKRRDNGIFFMKKGNKIDNRWIVPYNKWLSLKYKAHINCEICSTVKSVKYLFKYVYKGFDCALLRVNTKDGEIMHWDEVDTYLDTRYVSANEACWRIFKFKMHEQSHSIQRLAIHLPNQQEIYFKEGEEIDALADAKNRRTTLTAWFDLNNTDPTARNCLYVDIPYEYTFYQNKWKPRCQGKVISRMYAVSPSDIERYHLRVLLLHVKGAKSFNDLKTFEGIEYKTFKEAAKARNLIPDDSEWDKCLTDAEGYQMPKQLRQLFAIICIFCNPTSPLELWNKHKEYLIEDFSLNLNEYDAEQKALADVQEFLQMHSKSCSDFGLPEPEEVTFNDDQFNVEEERKKGIENVALLNADQRYAYETIIKAVENLINDKYFFLDGPGGSGKTFLYNTLINVLQGRNLKVIRTAFTGIAANLLDGGRTIHSRFRLPLKITETSTSQLRPTSIEAQQIKEACLIIFDEVTMISCHAMSCIDRLLRDITNIDKPFGEKIILFGGDFRQTLPITKRANRTMIVESTIKNYPHWSMFKTLKLSKNMRTSVNVTPLQESQEEFNDFLIKMGNGELKNSSKLGEDVIEIPQEFLIQTSIITEIYGNQINLEDIPLFADRAILCAKNEDALKLNEEILDRLEGNARTYYSIDTIDDELGADDPQEALNFPLEFLNKLTPGGMPLHSLNLKVGAIIMLLRNINVKRGLCNGTRLIIKALMDNVIDAEIITGKRVGDRVFIPRIELTSEDTDMPFSLKRRQFPVRISFAMTINKSQGQSFDLVGIYLPEVIFSHGQLYVAFSRAKAKSKVKVRILKSNDQGKLVKKSNKIYTKNIVYREIFSD